VKDHLGVFLGALVLVFAAIGVWAVMKRRRRSQIPSDAGVGLNGDGVSGE